MDELAEKRAGAASATSNGHGDPDDVPEPGPAADVPLDGEEDDAPQLPEMRLDLGNKITLKVGGKNPTGSTITLRGGRIPLEGQVEKGEILDVRLRLRCVDLQFPDKIDSKTGEVTETTRVQVMRAMQIQRLDSEE
jgi:hypothetical protein